MNLFFRLLYIFLFSKRRTKVGLLETARTPFRVYPSDLDILRHMNNGKYFSLQDLARVDYMIRAEVAQALDKNGWYPVVVAETIQFKKSLELFEKFEIHSRVICWDEKYFVLEHQFVANKEVKAYGLIKARFLKKAGGTVTPQEIVTASGTTDPSPPVPAHVQTWLQSSQEHSEHLGLKR